MKPALLSRRDILKLLSLSAAPFIVKAVEPLLAPDPSLLAGNAPGVVMLVLDTLSALNMSLYGYKRQTTPNMERFASRATVYSSHYSTANFTSPGTASLLTGLHPWTHRAFHNEGLVTPRRVEDNLFRYWGDASVRLAYTQNAWVELLLHQFAAALDIHLDPQEFNLGRDPYFAALFKDDPIAAYRAINSFSLEMDPNLSASPLSALQRKMRFTINKRAANKKYLSQYPMGVPMTVNDVGGYFLLEDVFDGLMNITGHLPPSSLAYLHLYPPHFPYAPRKEFFEAFDDGWTPPEKPLAHLVPESQVEPQERITQERRHYDSYIATVDDDFGRLLDFMEREGVLDRNYIILTSDHGDLYERGVIGHTNEYLYEPLVHVPLIISSPGQTQRRDIFTPTSSIDLLPTILSLAGRPLPSRTEGMLLPGLGGDERDERSIFSIDTKGTPVLGAIRTATVSLRKGRYKLIAYLGYQGMDDRFELFDLQNDPEEMNNLAASKAGLLHDLRAELDSKLVEVNQPYL